MNYFLILILIRIVYKYRYQILRATASIYLYIYDYFHPKVNGTSIIYNKNENGIHHYTIVCNSKEYTLKLYNETHKIDENNVKDVLEKQELITHCCLLDKDDNYLVDLTSDLRPFSYYFDKDIGAHEIDWIKIIKHFKDLHQLSEDVLYSAYLNLHMNDEYLTEHKLKVEELLKKV
jgi:hypothetical protein